MRTIQEEKTSKEQAAFFLWVERCRTPFKNMNEESEGGKQGKEKGHKWNQ